MIGVHSWSAGHNYHPAKLKRDPRQKDARKIPRR